MTPSLDRVLPAHRQRASAYFRDAYGELATQVDRMMLLLLAAEWLGLVAAAVVVSPRTWSGAQSSLHPHLWAAIISGPVLIFPAIAVALMNPGTRLTRHVVAVTQMLVSALLIDVSGGRIETHFHVFGSLAFLAFYRDWPVLLSASAVTALDHVGRGVWWPQSVYGVMTVSPWRWVEHAWWVSFEDFFLILATRRNIREMWAAATAKARLYEGAYHDVLTGLANRRLLQETFDAERAVQKKMSVLFVDLDRFKQANDTLGHTVGDKLLALVSDRLAKVTGANMLARVGGDEFVVLLSENGEIDHAEKIAARILSALAKPFHVEGDELLLSASIGITVYPDHGTELAVLQERADRAMYVAKSRGRNQWATFCTEVALRENALKELGRDLYRALSGQQFQLHFQPLVNGSGTLVSFEALLRWMHPVHGQIPPSDFIPLAERAGLMTAIGEWVLDEACRHCAGWQEDGAPAIPVGVNISAMQLEQTDFADRVVAILQARHLAPSLLTLELTESTLIRSAKVAREHLDRLRDFGVRVSLDDFGTGYSSLSYLTTLPADTIKLDRSFLQRESEDSAAVVESIISLAHRLGLRVVGEGVETRAQNERLLTMECDEMQGFYFSPPVPAAAAAELVAASRGLALVL